MLRSRNVRMQLVGGLGNQLFQYFAGVALSEKLGVELKLDMSWIHEKISGHKSKITDFDLPGNWVWKQNSINPRYSPSHWKRRLSLQMDKSELLSKVRSIKDYSKTPGWNPDFLRESDGGNFRGYFQSWKYYQVAVDYGFDANLRLKTPSGEFKKLCILASQEEPISVHIRRGDYLNSESFGVLTLEYYENAISLMKQLHGDRPLWIFSDTRFSRPAFLKGKWISRQLAPAEVLLLMSQSFASITANSSFSWWGAWVGKPKKTIIAPEPWFRNQVDYDSLIPENWLRLPGHQGKV